MGRARVLVIVGAVALFALVGAVLMFANQGPAAQQRIFQLQVAGSSMSPDQLRANYGDTLTISVTADKPEEVHLHGYDKHFFPGPGQLSTLSFPADRTGTFVLELEASSTPLGVLQVQPKGGLFGIGQPPDQSSTTVVKQPQTGLIAQVGYTSNYNVSLEIGPLQAMYTPAQVAALHPNSGEVMFSGQMQMPPGADSTAAITQIGANSPPGWKHLEVHVFDKRSGAVVKTLVPVIQVSSKATGQNVVLPITTMQGITGGPSDFHYGNNIELQPGRYTVAVKLNEEMATFDINVTS